MWVSEKGKKFIFRERYVHPVTGERKTVSVTLEKNTAQSRKKAMQLLRAKMEIAPSAMTLHDLIGYYLTDQEHTVALNTFQRNQFAMKRIEGLLGNVKLDKITAGYVRKRFLDDSDKPSTYNERIARFKALFRWGYKNDYLNDIKWLDKLDKLPDEEKIEKLDNKFYESDELKMLLAEMKVDKWRYLATLTALSGMRVGEAIALRVDDIGTDTISVTKTYDMINGIVTDPKTLTSNREIYMQPELKTLCREIKRAMLAQDTASGCRSVYLLHNVDGSPLDYFAYNKYLSEVSQRTVGKKASSHIMRHTHVALLAEQGVPLDVISRRLGHKDSKITKDVYFHVTERRKMQDNETISMVNIL